MNKCKKVIFTMLSLLLFFMPIVLAANNEFFWYKGDTGFKDAGTAGADLVTISNINMSTAQKIIYNASFFIHNLADYANTTAASVKGNNDTSMCAWIYETYDPTGGYDQPFFTTGDVGTANTANVYAFNADRMMHYGNSNNVNSTTKALPVNLWTHYCWIYTGSNKTTEFFINGTSIGSAARGTALNMAGNVVGMGSKLWTWGTGGYFTGYIGEIRFYNFTLTGDNITFLYNNSGGTNETLGYVSSGGASPPTAADLLNFSFQDPSDITSNNLFDRDINVTYFVNNTNTSFVAVWLNHTINSTRTCTVFINSTCNETSTTGQLMSPTKNVTSKYTWLIDEAHIYPATYNVEHDFMTTTAHINTSLTTNSRAVKIELLNISNETTYNFFEIFAFNSSLATSASMFYCNASYTSGSFLTSTFCTQFASLSTFNSFNHTDGNSKHILLPFNIVSGKVGTIKVTNQGYFILRGSSTGTWDYSSLSGNSPRTSAIQTTTNLGTTYSDDSNVVDAHLHQYNPSSQFSYYAIANYTGIINSTARRFDNLDVTPIAPTSPNFIIPKLNYNVSRTINISWTASSTFNSTALINGYNVTLQDALGNFLKTINDSTGNVTWQVYDFWANNFNKSNYTIKVLATDNVGQTSYAISDVFNLVNDSQINLSARNSVTEENLTSWTINATCTNTSINFFATSSTDGYIFTTIKGYWYNVTVDALKFNPLNVIVYKGLVALDYVALNLTADNINPTWVQIPQNQTFYNESELGVQFNATDAEGIDSYWLNETLAVNLNFSINKTGFLYNNSRTTVGNWSYLIYANDSSNNNVSARIFIFVQDTSVPDTTLPTWTETPVDFSLYNGTDINTTYNATDNIAIDKFWINDTKNFNMSTGGTLTNNDSTIEMIGVYAVQIYVNDTSNNLLAKNITITIVTTIIPAGGSSSGGGGGGSPLTLAFVNVSSDNCVRTYNNEIKDYIPIGEIMLGESAETAADVFNFGFKTGTIKCEDNKTRYFIYGIRLVPSIFLGIVIVILILLLTKKRKKGSSQVLINTGNKK